MVPSVGGRDLTDGLVGRGDISSSILGHMKINRNIDCPVVLCGCETWPLTLREERRLRVIRFVIPVVFNILIRVELIF